MTEETTPSEGEGTPPPTPEPTPPAEPTPDPAPPPPFDGTEESRRELFEKSSAGRPPE
jgi:hypothetical protein